MAEPEISIQRADKSCSDKLTARFIEELRLRTEFEILEQPNSSASNKKQTLVVVFKKPKKECLAVARQRERTKTFRVASGDKKLAISIVSIAERVAIWFEAGRLKSKSQRTQKQMVKASERLGQNVVSEAARQATLINEQRNQRSAQKRITPKHRKRWRFFFGSGLAWMVSPENIFPVARPGIEYSVSSSLGTRITAGLPITESRWDETGGRKIYYAGWDITATLTWRKMIGNMHFSGGLGARRLAISISESRPIGDRIGYDPSVGQGEDSGTARTNTRLQFGKEFDHWSIVGTFSGRKGLTDRIGIYASIFVSKRLTNQGLRSESSETSASLGWGNLEGYLGVDWRF